MQKLEDSKANISGFEDQADFEDFLCFMRQEWDEVIDLFGQVVTLPVIEAETKEENAYSKAE